MSVVVAFGVDEALVRRCERFPKLVDEPINRMVALAEMTVDPSHELRIEVKCGLTRGGTAGRYVILELSGLCICYDQFLLSGTREWPSVRFDEGGIEGSRLGARLMEAFAACGKQLFFGTPERRQHLRYFPLELGCQAQVDSLQVPHDDVLPWSIVDCGDGVNHDVLPLLLSRDPVVILRRGHRE